MSTTLPDIPAWIARTKLHPPRLRADAIERTRLLHALTLAVPSTPVVLLSAPAGSGKTTLLAQGLGVRSGGRRVAFLIPTTQFPTPNQRHGSPSTKATTSRPALCWRSSRHWAS